MTAAPFRPSKYEDQSASSVCGAGASVSDSGDTFSASSTGTPLIPVPVLFSTSICSSPFICSFPSRDVSVQPADKTAQSSTMQIHNKNFLSHHFLFPDAFTASMMVDLEVYFNLPPSYICSIYSYAYYLTQVRLQCQEIRHFSLLKMYLSLLVTARTVTPSSFLDVLPKILYHECKMCIHGTYHYFIQEEFSMRIYVDANAGRDGNGTKEMPFRQINDAAQMAMPGDEVLVAPGVYREYVNPLHAGTKENRIIYRSTEPLGAVLTGAEEMKQWQTYE